MTCPTTIINCYIYCYAYISLYLHAFGCMVLIVLAYLFMLVIMNNLCLLTVHVFYFSQRHRVPKKVLTDQGREFVNEVNEHLSQIFGITHKITAAYHPQTNGLDERTNGTLKRALSKLVNEHQNDWDVYLDPVLFGLRTSVQESSKYTPFFLMYNRKARLPVQLDHLEEEEIENNSSHEFDEEEHLKRVENMKSVHQQVLENLAKAQEKQKKIYLKKANKRGVKSFIFSVGNLVLKRNTNKISRKGDRLQKVVLRCKVHVFHLKPYHKQDSNEDHSTEKNATDLEDDVVPSRKRPRQESKEDLQAPEMNETKRVKQSLEKKGSCKSFGEQQQHQQQEQQQMQQQQTQQQQTQQQLQKQQTQQQLQQQEKKREQQPQPKLQCNLDILKRYGEWLDDTIINAAQQLLKQQFSGEKGFQNTLLSQRLQFEVATHNSIQIHHVHNYWLTTSSDEEGNVHIYDSLARYKLSGQLKQQIASIYRTDQTEMKVSVEAVQQQKGPSDCGLFAVALAFDIAAGVDPQNINYIQAEMREHLLSCLCKGNITPFPRYFGKTASVRKCKPSVVRFRVYCICRQTECFGQQMVQCDNCQEWYHFKCVAYNKHGEIFYCPNCRE
ncbi:uncharacterized protein LOC134178647 [Corticium candelabrum]|uniref:uncharacterized protein LOC134178647 n=1 Tax=Corticium candelabrum TaxID=121492 RepID=UPI002E267F31|nr:uncharacterized protein LOC134178647 [Corticium candelabrum]